MIIGSKSDLGEGENNQRQVSLLEGIQFAHENACAFSEVSVKTGHNIKTIRETIPMITSDFYLNEKTRSNHEQLIKHSKEIDISKYINCLKKSGIS